MSASPSVGSESPSPLVWVDRPGRELLRLAWPITVSTLSFSMMTLVSTAFVARIGADELAGVGLGGITMFALICFGVGLLRGAKTLVSQAVGADRRDRIPDLLGAALGIGLGLGVIALIAGQLIGPLLVAVSGSPRAGAFAGEFLALRALAAPVLLLYAALREASYGQGDTRTPMRASVAGNAVNIGLDVVLILGLEWGVAGAAVAAIFANLTELFVLWLPMRSRVRAARWRWPAVRAVWAQGVPNGLQFIMEVGSFMILTLMIAHMGAVDGAAHQIVLHLINVSFLPAHALAEAAAVLVGQAVGGNQDHLIRRVAGRALALGAGYASIVLIGYIALGGAITDGMSAGDPVLASRALTLLHVSFAFLVADAANVIARGVLRGASDVRYAAIVGICSAWVCTPPLTWLLGIHFGLGAAGGWIGVALEIVVGAGLYWLRVYRGGWRPAAAAARRQIAGVAV